MSDRPMSAFTSVLRLKGQAGLAFLWPAVAHNQEDSQMKRQLVAACGAVAMVMMLMPAADASRQSKWSEWSAPVNLGAGINTSLGEAAPAISRDGLTLYFVSNRPGAPPD